LPVFEVGSNWIESQRNMTFDAAFNLYIIKASLFVFTGQNQTEVLNDLKTYDFVLDEKSIAKRTSNGISANLLERDSFWVLKNTNQNFD
jgi:hypothetical protein